MILCRLDRCDVSTQTTVDSEDASMQATVNSEDASTQPDFHVSDITTRMLLLLSLIPESEQADAICRLMQELAAKSAFSVPYGSLFNSHAEAETSRKIKYPSPTSKSLWNNMV